RATQGFADYIRRVSDNPSVAVSYDSRINSTLFARTAAEVFAANGIKVYIYRELMPTPALSFAVRKLGCDAGVMITASHNPAKYNGYKAYGPDGCQLNLTASEEVIRYVGGVDLFNGIKRVDFDSAVADGMINYIGDDVIEQFYSAVLSRTVNEGVCAEADLKVIYTPLNGTGNKPVREVLRRIGVSDITVVPEQEMPDGNFPTAPYPNPEIRQAFECALKLAENKQADLLLATDPDCDRVGIAVYDEGEYKLMSGNDVGAVMLNYLLSQRAAHGTLPEHPIAVKTIVSSAICDGIADKYSCEMRNVLTGFKFIGEQILGLEKAGEENRFVMGFEESYGYLTGTYVRDKDAVVASMTICEMAAFYKKQGKTLIGVMNELREEFGYYRHKQLSFTFEGASGMEKMAGIMKKLREQLPFYVAGHTLQKVLDYNSSVELDIKTRERTAIELPQSDVIAYKLSGGAEVIVRPSGTEPKIKAYVTVCGATEAGAADDEAAICAVVSRYFD
ncbi:MAG: phospho-sugar mutase, partial [Firmicutes bacterium]|nr:phospho-sugar mutase [Bacillota bacterium]